VLHSNDDIQGILARFNDIGVYLTLLQLGDAREVVRTRVQQIIQGLPKVYAYSRIFQLLLDHGLKSKVAKTRQGSLDELGGLLKRSGIGACEPGKAFPVIATMIADKDSLVRKSALNALRSEGCIVFSPFTF
jgi:cytoskeleton-associated protein 5